jgi:peptidyl-prolyl cis-trans isomerase B (cyclophilin B)
MNKYIFRSLIVAIFALTLAGCANSTTPIQTPESMITRHLDNHEDLVAEYTQAVLKTNQGDIIVEFHGEDSPITVNNFMNLAQEGFYDGVTFHRVIPDFMIQGGDPLSKEENRGIHGTGDPGYKFTDEFNDKKIVRGSLAMANSGPGTNGSQFFIVTAVATPHLDGRHTNFGYVVEGMDVVEAIEETKTDMRDNPVEPIIIHTIQLVK